MRAIPFESQVRNSRKANLSNCKRNRFIFWRYLTPKLCEHKTVIRCPHPRANEITSLEQALRNFSALTQGDIIEISYNSIIFGLLVMETKPGGEGISILDTDLEVDFAPPVGYVEPERPKAAPQPTMASKLNIDLSSQTPGSSRPASSMGGNFPN